MPRTLPLALLVVAACGADSPPPASGARRGADAPGTLADGGAAVDASGLPADGGADPEASSDEAWVVREGLVEATGDVANPDRGLFSWSDDARTRLVFVQVDLGAYCNTVPLPDAPLVDLEARLGKLRGLGKKANLRFVYAKTEGQRNACGRVDAQSIDVALAHVQKLATRGVFTRFRDAISVLEAGFFGLWGEWHDVGAPASTSLVQSAENRARLVRALLAALPADLPVLLRRPRFRKELEGGAAPLSAAELARVGFHNDCFLASADDSGTYDGGVSPDTWKRYIADATARGVPLGGETCNDDPTFTTCAVAEQELARLHFSYLNNDYDKAVLDRFRREGCYDRIAARLGYRLVATKLERTARVVAGAAMRVRVHLENRGYAPPRRPYGLALALRGGGAEVPLAVTRQTGAEPAGWAAGETSVYEATVAVPRSAAAGRYALTLRIALSGAPGGAEDVVRLANEALFDGRTGAHVLFDDVDVVPGGS